MSEPTYLVERDAWDARRRQSREFGEHDHRDTVCDRLHWQFWLSPKVEPLTVEFIAERVADRIAREKPCS